jgi:hypothetical protein
MTDHKTHKALRELFRGEARRQSNGMNNTLSVHEEALLHLAE